MQPIEWDKVFANHLANKELIEKYVTNSYNSVAKPPDNPVKNGKRT